MCIKYLKRVNFKLVFPQNVRRFLCPYNMATLAVQDRWKVHFTNLAAWMAIHLLVKTTCTALQREGGMLAFLVALEVLKGLFVMKFN